MMSGGLADCQSDASSSHLSKAAALESPSPIARATNYPPAIRSLLSDQNRESQLFESGRLRTEWLVCQSHYECQSNIQARNIVIVKMTNLAANA
jgi:hypothetical protein